MIALHSIPFCFIALGSLFYLIGCIVCEAVYVVVTVTVLTRTTVHIDWSQNEIEIRGYSGRVLS
jgi:GTP-dependent phosphoenolpyruvate carboxykinase